ncbi:MAG TPA: hypothetical protein VHZ26_02110 [Caulobacteraceae bacterium]|jgi:hypothetical protein|nr:hypothetical protein [Caulobacteraceae bacterium]
MPIDIHPSADEFSAKFNVFSVPALLANPALAPEGPGVYVALMPDGVEFLARWGYFKFDQRMPSVINGHPILYAGMSSLCGVRHRIDNHARGDSRVSTLRMTLGALLRKNLALAAITVPKKTYFHFGDREAHLSTWIRQNLMFGFHSCSNPAQLERHVIRNGVCPLNISERRAHPFSRHLMAIRHEMIVDARRIQPATAANLEAMESG